MLPSRCSALDEQVFATLSGETNFGLTKRSLAKPFHQVWPNEVWPAPTLAENLAWPNYRPPFFFTGGEEVEGKEWGPGDGALGEHGGKKETKLWRDRDEKRVREGGRPEFWLTST